MEYFEPGTAAVNPAETVTVDLWLVAGRAMVRRAEAVRDAAVARPAGEPGRAELVAATEADLARAREKLDGYKPGTGPLFQVGHVLGRKAAEIEGQGAAVLREADPVARAAADFEWSRELVRYAVRGHSQLRFRDGSEVPFVADTIDEAGEKVTVVSKATLDVYQASRFLGRLAVAAMQAQRLGEAEKNG